MLALVYLAAIVAANLSVAAFGPAVSVLNAFLFIGLDLSLRDRLQDQWRGRVIPRMLALILAGGLVSYLVNRDAGVIAIASTVAFVLASMADWAVYTVLLSRKWFVRANGSNVAGAAVDSLVFPTIAFGGFLPAVVLAQFAAKVGGGFIWSVILAVLVGRRESNLAGHAPTGHGQPSSEGSGVGR